MALVVDIGITTRKFDGSLYIKPIEQIEVRRLEPLGGDSQHEIHNYVAIDYNGGGTAGEPVAFQHRYGDGAKVCVEKALAALREYHEAHQ